MSRPSYKELWLYERKDRDEQLQWIRDAVDGNAKFRNSEPPYSEEEELARKIMQMHARIAELEAAQRWIPVSERLPETYKPVLTVDMSEATQVPVPAFYNPDTECWSTHFKYDLRVTHWMPLPESPIVYGKVCEE